MVMFHWSVIALRQFNLVLSEEVVGYLAARRQGDESLDLTDLTAYQCCLVWCANGIVRLTE
jgi:hypothetical protein